MRRLVLHFGMHKTGSSSLQIALAGADLGPEWEYADLGPKNHSVIIKSAFFQDRSRLRQFRLRNLSEHESLHLKAKHRRRFESALKNCRTENLIVSGEGVCLLTKDELSDLNATCLALGFQTEAVGYLREPKSWIESKFQQHLKGAMIDGMQRPGIDQLHKRFPRYREALSKFEEVFGARNVSYWGYEADGKCVVKDFLFRLGIKPRQITIQRRNESLSLRCNRFLYTYRKLGPAQIPGDLLIAHNRKLVSRLRHLKGPKLSFSKELIDPIIKSYQEDILWANSKLDSPLPPARNTDGLPGCVRNESDLFDYDPESIEWLASQISESHSDYSGDPNQIAMWVHTLYQRLCFKPLLLSRLKRRIYRWFTGDHL